MIAQAKKHAKKKIGSFPEGAVRVPADRLQGLEAEFSKPDSLSPPSDVGHVVSRATHKHYVILTESQRNDAIRRYLAGERTEALAVDYDVHSTTMYSILRPFRGKGAPCPRQRKHRAWVEEARARYENGERCADIAAVVGMAVATVELEARKNGWQRKKAHCYKCGAAVAPSAKRGSAQPRTCDACTLERYRQKARRRTPEQRRADREARSLRLKGRLPRTRVELEAEWEAQRKANPRRQRPLVQVGRFRHYGEPPTTRDGALAILQATLSKLLTVRCEAEGVRRDTIEYRARYRIDPAFRAKQKANTAGQKKSRGVLVSPDGSLTPEVVRRLFAHTSMCPYCDRLMASREKTLDHMHPVSRGGQHTLGNVTVCCHSCNSRKRSKEFGVWVRSLPPQIAARFNRERAA